MPSSGERTVAVAHHPTEIQPWQQTPYPGGINLSRDHGHRLVAKEARARSSVIDAEDVTAALARRELVQHGARSVAFAEGRTTTRQSVKRLLRCKQEEAPNPSSRSKGKANLLVRMEKQRPNTLTPHYDTTHASTALTNYRSGTVNSKSFVGKVLIQIKWKFELINAL